MVHRRDYLLDTNVVLHYARKSDVYVAIERQYNLQSSSFSPLVCVVTLGEIRAIAWRKRNNWNALKLQQLETFLANLVPIDIASVPVLEAYARIQIAALDNGWGIHNKKNDLWIAAVTHVTGASLLTTDGDFDSLHGQFIQRIRLDAHTGSTLM